MTYNTLERAVRSAVCNTLGAKSEKFDAVHSVTPKAGLLTSIAAFFARVPVRIHIYLLNFV